MEVALAEHSAADYYERRERQERGLAEAAPSPTVRKIHTTLARSYARLKGGAPKVRDKLHIVERQPE
jgi:hypothetical protein